MQRRRDSSFFSADIHRRSWPHRLGPNLRSNGFQVLSSMTWPPQPYSTKKPVAARIVAHDRIRQVPLVGECTGSARDLGAGGLDAGCDGVERGAVSHLPAEKGNALSAVGVDHEPLLAVVHAKRKRRTAPVD